MYQRMFQEIISKYGMIIYTDGSKDTDGVACAFVDIVNSVTSTFRLPDNCSMFTAELFALCHKLKGTQDSN